MYQALRAGFTAMMVGLLAACLALFATPQAFAGCTRDANGVEYNYMSGGGSCSGSSGGSGGDYSIFNFFDNVARALSPPRPSGPSPEDIAHSQANALNHRGVEAEKTDDYATAVNFFRQALQYWPDNIQIQKNIAYALNNEGVKADEDGNPAGAINFYQAALQYYNEDPLIQNNLNMSQAELARLEKEAEEKRQMQEKEAEEKRKAQEAAAKVQQSLAQLAQVVNANLPADQAATPGMSFIGANPPTTTAALTPVEPPTVDARNVPSGLPKSVDDAIPHTPTGDRVRKGFEAIQTHDWKVANAWFEDALNKDPNDAGLQRLVDMSHYMLERQQHPDAPPPADSPYTIKNLKAQADPKAFDEFREEELDWAKGHIPVQAPPQDVKTQVTNGIPPGDSKFGAGVPLDKAAATKLAHDSRVEALKLQQEADLNMITGVSLTKQSGSVDDRDFAMSALQSDTAQHMADYANSVERCQCSPVTLPADKDVELLFPHNDDNYFLFPNNK